MRKANAQRILNHFALSLNASCFGAELAAAVVLPVQAVLLRKLQAAQVAVVLFEVRGQMLYPELCLQFLPDGIDPGSVLVGADGQGGGTMYGSVPSISTFCSLGFFPDSTHLSVCPGAMFKYAFKSDSSCSAEMPSVRR